MRIALRAAIAAVVTVFAAAAPAAAGSASLTPGSRYLALGDSVVFGYQEPQVVPAPNYHNAASFLGYPEQFGAALHLRVVNAACPAETSASLIKASAPSNGCENSPSSGPAYRKLFPLHVRYKGSQLAYAVKYLRAHPDVRLVSVTIGANDLFLCQATTTDACTSAAELQAVYARISANLRTILSAIRHKAHYAGRLALVNYYSLNYASPAVSNLTILGNQLEAAVARPFHVVVADAYAELKAASLHFGGDPCKAGLLNMVGPSRCGVHPSYAGQALLAQALEKAVTR